MKCILYTEFGSRVDESYSMPLCELTGKPDQTAILIANYNANKFYPNCEPIEGSPFPSYPDQCYVLSELPRAANVYPVVYEGIRFLEYVQTHHKSRKFHPIPVIAPIINMVTIIPHGHYAFICMKSGELRIATNYEGCNLHVYISGAAQEVKYAGTIDFNYGQITSWSNRSGSYCPKAENKSNTFFD